MGSDLRLSYVLLLPNTRRFATKCSTFAPRRTPWADVRTTTEITAIDEGAQTANRQNAESIGLVKEEIKSARDHVEGCSIALIKSCPN